MVELQAQTRPWLIRTAVDDRLCERLRLVPFDLIRLRREFYHEIYSKLSHKGRRTLAMGGMYPRFELMDLAMLSAWNGPLRSYWLGLVDHPQRDIDEMIKGTYPISPYVIRLYSALFGIRPDFLLLGREPAVERNGTSIEVWPMAGSR